MLKNIWNIFRKTIIIGLRVVVVIMMFPIYILGLIIITLNTISEILEQKGKNRDG